MTPKFDALVSQIAQIGLEHHKETILENSRCNRAFIKNTIRDIGHKAERPCLVVSAGPSLYREAILTRVRAEGITIVATDGAYIQCLKAGIVPDWVVTIDPHPTRIVRWFGDPELEKNEYGDDYFKRQDLDVMARGTTVQENAANVSLVDANKALLAICSTSPENVVARTGAFQRYWFAPLVDSPESHDSITNQIVLATGLPALNTGGTVGTAAWVFALQVLQSNDIAVAGMDFGYPADTPLNSTQEWNLTGGDPELYPRMGDWYTSPTYWWYRGNFLDLLEAADATITNCSEGGLLDGPRVKRMKLETWLKSSS